MVTTTQMTGCATCHPPSGGDGRLHEGHVGVRWHDHARGRWGITLNGRDVTNLCVEACAPGWVVLVDEPMTACGDDHARSTVHYGHVIIQVQR